jgi:hypothetical protein
VATRVQRTAPPAAAAPQAAHQFHGKPITSPGAKLSVQIAGVSSKSGEKVYYNPAVKPDGSYEQKLVDGSYQFTGARIDIPFNNKQFSFALEPVGDDRSDREAAQGIVQDYVWKLRGLRPGYAPDESNFTHWHGGSVNMSFQLYREDLKKAVNKAPGGTKCVFTLTPKGKLIDGSEGKVLTFTREFDTVLTGLKNSYLHDVPIGLYTVKGEEISPDGSKKPLAMEQQYGKYGETADVEFAPGSSAGVWPPNIGFSRNE